MKQPTPEELEALEARRSERRIQAIVDSILGPSPKPLSTVIFELKQAMRSRLPSIAAVARAMGREEF
jgi:hypothetical protein